MFDIPVNPSGFLSSVDMNYLPPLNPPDDSSASALASASAPASAPASAFPVTLPTVGPADAAVFWDYENVRIPEWCPPGKISDGIREAVLPYGRIVERRLYYDPSKPSEQYLPRSHLDLSGFTLVDCPSRNNKETLDKKLIVDILFFAWERASRGAKACVVLITSDGDFSYTLARLQDIGVFTIIIFRPDVVAKVLIDNANVVLNWEHDVLGNRGNHHTGAFVASPSVLPSFFVERYRALSTSSDIESTGKNCDKKGSGGLALQKKTKPSKNLVLFLTCVLVNQQRRLTAGGSLHQTWGVEGSIASEFYNQSSKDKERYHNARMEAIKRDLVECGRRNLEDLNKMIVKCEVDERSTGQSLETYLRLTPSGFAMTKYLS